MQTCVPRVHQTLSIQLRGGLGNQLFQIAACALIARLSGRIMAFRSADIAKNPHLENTPYEDDTSYILQPFNITLCVEDAHVGFVQWDETDADPSPSGILARVLEQQDFTHIVLTGFFITHMFVSLCTPLDLRFVDVVQNMHSGIDMLDMSCTVALHIRRGDYLEERWSWLHVNLRVEDEVSGYYARALTHFPETATIMVFSDDSEWCKQQKLFKKDRVVHAPTGISPLQTLCLMSKCELGCITANSTFSWWGAWMNKTANKTVIMPLYWNNLQSAGRICGVFDIFFPGVTVLNN